MAILLVHNLEHFIFPVYPADSPQWLVGLDRAVFDVTFFLFAGKAYAIFALLFGFTFYIQSHNQELHGRDFGGRFMWRLLLLAGFACLNAAFFPAGDVLLLFAIVGGVLVIVRHWSDKAVFALALFCLLQPFEWFCFFADYRPDLHVGEMYAEVAAVNKSGNFADFLVCNLGLGQKASLLWAVGAGRFVQTAGLFLLGYWIGRKRLFVSSAASIRFWKLTLMIASLLFLPLYFGHAALVDVGAAVPLITVVDMWQKLAFTFVLVSGFMLLYELTGFKRHTTALQLYGKMSLTNYVLQSIIGALIYFPFGLYLAPRCGYTLSLLIGIGVFAAQLIFSRLWLSQHRQGPLEALWHRLTWLRSSR